MPDWGKWLSDCASLLNWFLYYGSMCVIILIYVTLFVFVMAVFFKKALELKDKFQLRKLDKELEKISESA